MSLQVIIEQKHFHCRKCGLELPSLTALSTHSRKDHHPQLHCRRCNQPFDNQSEMIKHLRQHPDRIFRCRRCSLQFQTYTKMISHCWSVHERLLHCRQCNIEFQTWKDLKDHQRIHVHFLTCSKCGQKFLDQGSMRKHIFKRHGITCKICQALVPNSVALHHHFSQVHHLTRKCKYCGVVIPYAKVIGHVTRYHHDTFRQYGYRNELGRFVTNPPIVGHEDGISINEENLNRPLPR